MSITGIVRRVDDLGRVAIPKEIRRTLRIREGDPLEIIIQNGMACLKKYSPVFELGERAMYCAEAIFEEAGHVSLVTDREKIVAVAGVPKKTFLGQPIPECVEKVMDERKGRLIIGNTNTTGLLSNFGSIAIAPIIVEGDPLGAVIICSDELAGQELRHVEVMAKFLSKDLGV